MSTNDGNVGKCTEIKAIYSFATHIQINLYCRHTCHQPKINPYLVFAVLMSRLKWIIFGDGYISQISEILFFPKIYNPPKYQKIPIPNFFLKKSKILSMGKMRKSI